MPADPGPRGPILLTGATGYIGGRLAPRLLDAGHRVRCVARDPRKLEDRPWFGRPGVEVVRVDVGDTVALERAMEGCSSGYYLVHSMLAAGGGYAERDRELASSFARAAEGAGLDRIVYLGGLGETGPELSQHLASRREVEEALDSGATPLTVLRAAMIIGSGSASFEILRYLVERLPVMITPRWVRTECQPIAVRDVLHYLVSTLGEPATVGRTLDIGGPDILSYHRIMQIMAEELEIPRRWILPVPVLTPKLSSAWIHLVTPLSARIARPLAEGLRNRVVCRNDEAARAMPRQLLTVREAIREAIRRVSVGEVETSWSDAGPVPGDPDWAGGTTFVDRRETGVAAPAEQTFRAICRIGGTNGWYAANALWHLRGFLDQLVGGPGLRRGRRDPDRLAYGDALDFWRVTAVERDRLLRLRAEMRLPGEAVLEFTLEPERDGDACRLVQTAHFKPRGLLGILYWYAVMPLHGWVFRGMLEGLRREAERRAAGSG